MSIRIHTVALGIGRCYIIQAKSMIMVDAGAPGQAKNFIKAAKAMELNPADIALMVITHGHWDHIGSARDIKAATGAKIAMHRLEKDWLEKSAEVASPRPPAVTMWGRILAKPLAMVVRRFEIPPANVEVTLDDQGLSLAEYGIRGSVVHTPGHTPGSVSVVLETGDAFVGDLAMNGLPLRLSPGLPIFAEDLSRVRETWRLLLDKGIQMVYPGHGKPFPAEIMRKALV